MPNFGFTDPTYLKVVDDSSFSRDGLVLHLDASDWYSYPRTGTTWKDISGNARGRNIEILSTAYNSSGPKYMDFNGSYGCAKFQNSDWVPGTNTVTAILWTRILNNASTWRTLFRGLSSGNNHQVIIQAGGWAIGFYDNDSGTGFNSAAFSQQDIPGYGTTKWNMLVWRYSTSSPYYTISYNDSPDVIRGQSTSTYTQWGATRGICSIGAYNDANQNACGTASQYWGDIASVMIFNRILSNQELLGHYQARKNRFGL